MRRCVAVFTCILIAFSVLTGCSPHKPISQSAKSPVVEREIINDPAFGKSYRSIFFAYTHGSGHPDKTPWYCLTDDGYFVTTGYNPFWCGKLEPIDATEYPELYTGDGYWQDYFSPEYITENTVKAWYGQGENPNWEGRIFTDFWYVFLLKDGYILVATGQCDDDFPNDPTRCQLLSVSVLEYSRTQEEFFAYWNEQYGQEATPRWDSLYQKYQ